MSVLIPLPSATPVALCATGVAVCTLRAWALRPQGLSLIRAQEIAITGAADVSTHPVRLRSGHESPPLHGNGSHERPAGESRRVARELHDRVAHDVSAMLVQAQAARAVLHYDRAEVALAAISER